MGKSKNTTVEDEGLIKDASSGRGTTKPRTAIEGMFDSVAVINVCLNVFSISGEVEPKMATPIRFITSTLQGLYFSLSDFYLQIMLMPATES